jgi:hypothetical protein
MSGALFTRAATDGERWLVPALSILPLAKRTCRVRDPRNGVAMKLSAGEYAALAASTAAREPRR